MLSTKLFDTHAHLDDENFDAIRDEVVARFVAAGVDRVVTVGTTSATSHKCVEIANKYANVFAAVGIQPNYCADVTDDQWQQIVSMCDDRRVIAVGETGLDRYWDYAPFDRQIEFFQRHLKLSRETGLPFIVHMRDCQTDILDVLATEAVHGPLNGVMHSFTGTTDGATSCLEWGMYISFAGMVTYKKSHELRNVARSIPSDRILIETDAPYLSPHPKRGQRPNEPSLIVHTAKCLAEVRGVTVDVFARQTTENAVRLFEAKS